MSFDQLQDELHHHEQEIARISNVLARVAPRAAEASDGSGAKPEVLYLQAQMIRHRISLALLDAQAEPLRGHAA